MIERFCRKCKADLLQTLQLVEEVAVIRVTPIIGASFTKEGYVSLEFDFDATEEEDLVCREGISTSYSECSSCGTKVKLEDIPILFGATP